MTARKLAFAWKYRRPLWKYRKLVAHRREIAAMAIAGAALLALTVIQVTNRKRAAPVRA
jgi:hypothetical protein